MIRVNVFYPATEGGRFDFDYYTKTHTPMVVTRMTPFGLKALTAERGVAGLAPGSPATYICVATLHFTSVEDMQRGLNAHGAEIMGDIPKYTDAQPVIQVSEVLV